jgi:hypothetical protein
VGAGQNGEGINPRTHKKNQKSFFRSSLLAKIRPNDASTDPSLAPPRFLSIPFHSVYSTASPQGQGSQGHDAGVPGGQGGAGSHHGTVFFFMNSKKKAEF